MLEAVDLNSDVGESYGNYAFGSDEQIMPYLSSANVACGFHAGDPVTMEKTVRLAKKHGVAVGVHWGLPDIAGFGRRRMDISIDDARCLTTYQIGALKAFTDSADVEIDHLVPHGALYSMLAQNESLAQAMVNAITALSRDWVLYWPTPLEPHSFYDIAQKEGLRIIPEIAADLEYRANGSLVIERVKQAWDPNMVADRVQRFVETGRVRTVDGADLEFEASAVLIHGDAPNAGDTARAVRTLLNRLGIRVAPASTLAAPTISQARRAPVGA